MDDLVTEEKKKSATRLKVQEPDPLEARVQHLEAELKRVLKPVEKKTGEAGILSEYFNAICVRQTLEDRIQALEDAKKPRCKTCKKIK